MFRGGFHRLIENRFLIGRTRYKDGEEEAKLC